jgi:hypothetical protein
MSEAKQPQLVKMLSTRTVFGTKADIQKLVLADETANIFLYRIYGEISGYVQGKGRFRRIDKETGEVQDTFWTKFAGEFVAQKNDGSVMISSLCFLPDYVAGPYRQRLENDPDSELTFAYDIYAKFSKDSATSYEYIAVPVRTAAQSNRLAEMIKALPALPAPGKVTLIEGNKS